VEGDFITYCNGNTKVIIAFAIMSIERNGTTVYCHGSTLQ
jgi:hypothetical protein